MSWHCNLVSSLPCGRSFQDKLQTPSIVGMVNEQMNE